ncbi:hypothetical protein PSHT_11868, partial [Puccinia striiformis]
DIVATLNLQHNCHNGKCTIEKTKMTRIERQETNVRVCQVCHADSKNYILNSVPFHASEEHQQMANLSVGEIDTEDITFSRSGLSRAEPKGLKHEPSSLESLRLCSSGQ